MNSRKKTITVRLTEDDIKKLKKKTNCPMVATAVAIAVRTVIEGVK